MNDNKCAKSYRCKLDYRLYKNEKVPSYVYGKLYSGKYFKGVITLQDEYGRNLLWDTDHQTFTDFFEEL